MKKPILAGLAILVISILACRKATTEEIRGFTLTPSYTPVVILATASIESTDTGTPAPTDTGTPYPTDTPLPVSIVKAIQALNVRSYAGESAKIIGQVRSGDTVTLTGRCYQGWAQIVYKGVPAWVKASFLSGDMCK